MSYNYGIIPEYTFDDVSAQLVGESITLVDVSSTYDLTADSTLQFSVAASLLNAGIADNADGTITASTLSLNNDLTRGSGFDAWFKGLTENSYKASIAKALTGYNNGDIGELENDTNLSGSTLANASVLNAIVLAVETEVNTNTNALRALAEDIIREAALNATNGSGRDPANPFQAGDALDFRMVFLPGSIDVVIDALQALTTDATTGTTIVSTHTADAAAGLAGFNTATPFTVGAITWSTDRSNASTYLEKSGNSGAAAELIVAFRIVLA